MKDKKQDKVEQTKEKASSTATEKQNTGHDRQKMDEGFTAMSVYEMISRAVPQRNKVIISGLIVIAIFFGGLGVWAAFFPFSGAVIAPGVIKVSMNNQIVQHLEGGIVDHIYVKDGDEVKKGDILVKLKSEKVDATVEMLRGQLWSMLADKARLEAQARMKDTIDWPDELKKHMDNPKVQKIMQSETEVFDAARKDLKGRISLSEAQIVQLQKAIKGYEAELKAKKAVVKSLEEELDAKEDLYKKKYLDKVPILQLRRRIAEYLGEVGKLQHQIAETEKHIDEIKLQIIDIKNRYKESAFRDLNKINHNIIDLRQRLRPILDAQKRLDIKAPINGRVYNIKVHAEEGSVLRPGQEVLEIVPEGARLVAEAYIRPNDIAHVHVGQDVMVQLIPFNRRTVPPAHGKVIYVSPDLVRQSRRVGMHQSFYKVHVAINEKEVKKNGAYLLPGMPVVCYLKTEERTILTYLLEPLLEMVYSSMRETS